MGLSECQWFYSQLRRQSWPIVVVGATRYILGIIPDPGPDLAETITQNLFYTFRHVFFLLLQSLGRPDRPSQKKPDFLCLQMGHYVDGQSK